MFQRKSTIIFRLFTFYTVSYIKNRFYTNGNRFLSFIHSLFFSCLVGHKYASIVQRKCEITFIYFVYFIFFYDFMHFKQVKQSQQIARLLARKGNAVVTENSVNSFCGCKQSRYIFIFWNKKRKRHIKID